MLLMAAVSFNFDFLETLGGKRCRADRAVRVWYDSEEIISLIIKWNMTKSSPKMTAVSLVFPQ